MHFSKYLGALLIVLLAGCSHFTPNNIASKTAFEKPLYITGIAATFEAHITRDAYGREPF